MRKDLNGILGFVGLLWIVFLINSVFPAILSGRGLIPRTATGLQGIITMPFLHASIAHLVSNSVPLVVLLLLLFGSQLHPVRLVIVLSLLSGLMLWIFGRPREHVGASALIYSLAAFLIVSGIAERRPVSIAISILVGFLYGGTLIWGVLPVTGEHISWEGHLLGAITGGILAWGLAKYRK
jgi:membrane associated rhomboid family serine protease